MALPRVMRIAAVLLALAGASLAAGCGGGGSGSGSDTPSRADFAKNADGICADVEKRVTELNQAKPQSIGDLRRFIDQLKAAVEDGIKRLQALDRPTGGDGQVAKQFTDNLDREYSTQVLPALNDLEKAVVKRDKKGLAAASKRLDSIKDTKSRQLAARLGAKQCAQG